MAIIDYVGYAVCYISYTRIMPIVFKVYSKFFAV